nr:MAG TPA: hypothetical protein [Caudoviricetes sp.]
MTSVLIAVSLFLISSFKLVSVLSIWVYNLLKA